MTKRLQLCNGQDREESIDLLKRHHYAHSVSSGKSYYFTYGSAIIVYSIPANKNIAGFILGEPGTVWELSRLWAPNGHGRNLLTAGIAASLKELVVLVSELDAVVAYADPNVGHEGGVYRAASWIYLGQCEEGRYYRDGDGQVVARRKFHSGSKHLTKAEIEALGYAELKLPGKHRFVKLLSQKSKICFRRKWWDYRKR